jgi:predicted unusual protein kinase regulating ubiquinone biosynthesis (AarF/ABC1/UbiB family)
MERCIPHSRFSRLMHLGRLAGGIAGGALGEGMRQIRQGQRPALLDLLLTPGNAGQLADRLAEMRGAAMKVGQLLSMEAGEFLPREFSDVLQRLRDAAHPMPLVQLKPALDAAWGRDWEKRFRYFSYAPIAAASIGQVHEAVTLEGQRLAIKIQYPGIRDSIDSDVNNVASLLKLFHWIPDAIDLDPLLTEARQQLHQEADYGQEAEWLTQFAARLDGHPDFAVPTVVAALTTPQVLAMSYLEGRPIEDLEQADAAERHRVAAALFDLSLREVFDWGLVQTDPNFANYRYAPDGCIQLLDFGAARLYPQARREAFRALAKAGVDGTPVAIEQAAIRVSYLDHADPPAYRAGVVDLIRTAFEPARSGEEYDFGRSDLARRASEQVLDLRFRQRFSRLPPPDVLFLHRKLGGLYLLFKRLRATLPLQSMMRPFIAARAGA